MPAPLDSRAVRLLPGPFADARARNAQWLRALDPERLLHRYDLNAGFTPTAPIYGGWESATLSGHTLGHYLSACARLAASDPAIARNLSHTVQRLARCQDARDDHFLGGMPEPDRVFGELRAGVVRSSGFDLNDCWVPWYNLHKLLAGLVDTARLTGDDTARQVAVRMGDWAIGVTAGLDADTWQTMLACEHGGMNEALADLADLAGADRFLDLARRFHHHAVLDPLARGEDRLAGLHANTQIPKVLGCARLHELTGDPSYRDIAENFWRVVVDHHTYATGGHGSGEHFGPPDTLSARLSNTNCETCNSYNMLRLTRQLFAWEPRARLTDYAERTLVNHILASQRPTDGMVAYFMPLESGRFRTHSTLDASFWCCVGTGLENHARHEEYVASADERALWIHLGIAAEISHRGATVRIDTAFPDGAPDLRITVSGLADFVLKLRCPAWLADAAVVLPTPGPDGYVTLLARDHRIALPTLPRVEPLPDAPDRVATFDGPVLLAADLGPAPGIDGERGDEAPDAQIPPAPVLVGDQAPPMAPYWRLWDRRTAVYLDRFPPEDWAREEAGYREREAAAHALWTRWIDTFWPFQMQPERDHDFRERGATGGERSAWKFRQAQPGGMFSFTIAALPDTPMELVCTWGPPTDTDAAWDLLVDGEPVASPRLAPERHRHIEAVTALPDALTAGKESIRVEVRASPDLPAAPLFLCRTRKRM